MDQSSVDTFGFALAKHRAAARILQEAFVTNNVEASDVGDFLHLLNDNAAHLADLFDDLFAAPIAHMKSKVD